MPGEVFRLFFWLGLIAFGGPAAHIALFRDEVVRRRQWLDDQHFLDLLGATNLIPGPNSTEMAIHIGYVRAGWRGLVAAGVAFILPAMLLVMGLAWLYAQYGSLPQATWLLYGVKPAILAVVIQALWVLGKTAIKGPLTTLVGVAALALYVLRVNEILILVLAALFVLVVRLAARGQGDWLKAALPLAPGLPLGLAALQAGALPTVGQLFLTFLKIGSVLYGSGYVLLAFLRSDFVVNTGWLTDQQLLDAIAIGQFTPGPVFTTATFIGFLLGGWPGAVVSTIGIFLPAFVFVALSNPLIPRIRQSTWAGPLLDGVNVASLGLMAAVTWQLGRAAVIDGLTALIAVAAAVLLLRYRVNSAWLVAGGAVVGIVYKLVVG